MIVFQVQINTVLTYGCNSKAELFISMLVTFNLVKCLEKIICPAGQRLLRKSFIYLSSSNILKMKKQQFVIKEHKIDEKAVITTIIFDKIIIKTNQCKLFVNFVLHIYTYILMYI